MKVTPQKIRFWGLYNSIYIKGDSKINGLLGLYNLFYIKVTPHGKRVEVTVCSPERYLEGLPPTQNLLRKFGPIQLEIQIDTKSDFMDGF